MNIVSFLKQSLTHVASLFTTVGGFISIGLFCSSAFLLFIGVAPYVVCLRASYGICSLIGVLLLLRVPAIKEHMAIIKQDALTIAAHWANDKDLVRLTWYLRAGYGISAISVIVGVVLWCQYDMAQVHDYMVQLLASVPDLAHQGMIFECLYSTKGFAFFTFGLILFVVTRTVQFCAACHIILYRNTPVRAVFASFCKECYTFGGLVAGVGVPVFGASSVVMASSPMLFPASYITNFVNIYIPGFHGHGFPLGTLTTQIRHVFFLELPKYNPLDHVGPDNMMNADSQHQFMVENIADIRKKCSIHQLQTMGVDPSLISNYTSGSTSGSTSDSTSVSLVKKD